MYNTKFWLAALHLCHEICGITRDPDSFSTCQSSEFWSAMVTKFHCSSDPWQSCKIPSSLLQLGYRLYPCQPHYLCFRLGGPIAIWLTRQLTIRPPFPGHVIFLRLKIYVHISESVKKICTFFPLTFIINSHYNLILLLSKIPKHKYKFTEDLKKKYTCSEVP